MGLERSVIEHIRIMYQGGGWPERRYGDIPRCSAISLALPSRTTHLSSPDVQCLGLMLSLIVALLLSSRTRAGRGLPDREAGTVRWTGETGESLGYWECVTSALQAG